MKNSIPNRARQRRDGGQVIVLFVLLMVVLILFLGLGIDLGFSYITRANLSKAVDAAALMGAMNLSSGSNTAQAVALSAFDLNYGVSGRDAEVPHVDVQIFNDNGNQAVQVTASVNINTYFIRVLPQWATLPVTSDAEAVRDNVIMTLVLDTSNSMSPKRGPPPGGNGSGSGGGTYLPGAVTAFINNFDDTHDQAAVVTFNTVQSDVFFGGTIAQPRPTQPFKAPIINVVNAFNDLTWTGYTFSQGGLTNALVMENNAVIPANEATVKIVVFCTDGFANVIQDTFNCPPSMTWNYGGKDSCPGGVNFFDSITGVNVCHTDDDGDVPTCCEGAGGFTCSVVTAEAQVRAIQVANQMRAAGIIVYSIGVGNDVNLNFLQQISNDPALAGTSGYAPTTYDGEAVLANDASQLSTVFQQIASKILLRLAK